MKGELTRREHVIGWAGLVVLVAIFLHWESIHFLHPSRTVHLDGWTATRAGWGGALLLAAAGEYLIAHRLGYRIWAPRFGDSRLAAGAAVIGLALLIIGWVALPSDPKFDTHSMYGLWLAVAAGIVETVALIDEARRPVVNDD